MNEFRRMMQRVLKKNWQAEWISLMIVLLATGLLISRALVSISAVGMILPFLFTFHLGQVSKWVLAGVGLILFPVIFSGFWSEDTTTWGNSVAVKIPLVTMMLGLSGTMLTKKRWLQLVWSFIVLLTIGCLWSLQKYISNPDSIHASYLQAKVLPTLSDNDYVRFSWMVVMAVFLGIKGLTVQVNRKANILLACLVTFLILFLHILAAKTGLVCLYAGGFVYLLHILFIQKKWLWGLGILIMLFAFAIFAYTTIPTLRNRVQYVVYDFSSYSKGTFTPGYNDGARWLSIRAGYGITQEHPLTGVGFGDIRNAVDQWHQANQPDSFVYERFLPANEWLVYGAGSGWPGILCFTAGLLILLYATTTKKITSVLLSAIAFIPFITDDSLEGQYGVVILAFIVFFGQRNFPPQTVST